MSIEDLFVERGKKHAKLEEFLENELGKSGYGGVDIQRTPTGTQVTLYVERPGVAIGRRGRSIQELTDKLSKDFGLKNPQVEVSEIGVPEFKASIIAERIAFLLSRGVYFRRVGYSTLRQIMDKGARGAEIVISGKLTGDYAREERFYDGYLKKVGDSASKLVSTGKAVANLPAGSIGIKVKIMPPEASPPDEFKRGEEEVESVEGKGGETSEGEVKEELEEI